MQSQHTNAQKAGVKNWGCAMGDGGVWGHVIKLKKYKATIELNRKCELNKK